MRVLEQIKESGKKKKPCSLKAFKTRRDPLFDKNVRKAGLIHLEVLPRFELGNEGFADLCLTTWLWHHTHLPTQIRAWARCVWSGRRDSDPRHPPWQGGTLPLSYYRMAKYEENGVENGAGEET